MLHDPRLHAELGRRIRGEREGADYAVNRVLRNYADALRRLDNPLLADRAEDVLDIENVVDSIRIDGQPWERRERRPGYGRFDSRAEDLVGEEEEAGMDPSP